MKKLDILANWVNVNNIHLTLKFLGEVEGVKEIKDVEKETKDVKLLPAPPSKRGKTKKKTTKKRRAKRGAPEPKKKSAMDMMKEELKKRRKAMKGGEDS